MIDFFKKATLFVVTILLCSAANAVDEISAPLEHHPAYLLKADLPLNHPSFQYLINDGSVVVSSPESMLPILTFSISYPDFFGDKNSDNIAFFHISPEFLEQYPKNLQIVANKKSLEIDKWKGWRMLRYLITLIRD